MISLISGCVWNVMAGYSCQIKLPDFIWLLKEICSIKGNKSIPFLICRCVWNVMVALHSQRLKSDQPSYTELSWWILIFMCYHDCMLTDRDPCAASDKSPWWIIMISCIIVSRYGEWHENTKCLLIKIIYSLDPVWGRVCHSWDDEITMLLDARAYWKHQC